MKTFAIGDIHGAEKALLQCIEFSGIDPKNDELIVLGDVVDGWSHVPACVEILLEFEHLIPIRGNHDQWFMDWVNTGVIEFMWHRQGGKATLDSYRDNKDLAKEHILKYFHNSLIYYIDTTRNYAFMHGGYDWHKPLKDNDLDEIMWNRHMIQTAYTWKEFNYVHEGNHKFDEFDKIFVGHTTTQHTFSKKREPSLLPAFLTNIINLDTGAGWNGKLTIMDVDSLEYWQSDLVPDLYPTEYNSRT